MDIHDLEMRKNDVYKDGNWNFNSLCTNIPPVASDRLKLFPICLNSLVPEHLTWKYNLNGIYTAQDGYYWLNKLEFI